jgi:uncharacterized membrane protein
MGLTIERIATNTLWFLTVLITFLLPFENELVLPPWVQTVGRMHPLVLHFPTVLVLLAGVFTLLSGFKGVSIPPSLTKATWLLGACSAGLTVVMGLFLSQEEGYSGQTLDLHRWTGAAVFYLSTVFYWLYSYPSVGEKLQKGLALFSVFVLIASGHLGAELTHGEGFLTAPIRSASPSSEVPLDQALVFDHLILPILDAKCLSCHNTQKAKGELSLIDSLHIAKGGKSGALINPFEPSLSLLIERLHLPLDDKKHMPPKGKAQLSPEEEAILIAWIRAGTPYRTKVIDIASQDTLSRLAKNRLKPRAASEEIVYDFKPARESDILRLTNEYRNVSPVALHSPGLSVDFYGSQAYQPQWLEELSAVKNQVVSLNLSRMPVKDAELKIIAGFPNLRSLNLNFTTVTGQGIGVLGNLKHLQSLYLAGVPLDEPSLQKLLANSGALKYLTLWETGLSEPQIDALRNQFGTVSFQGNFIATDTTKLQLNKPLGKSNDWVFEQTSEMELYHPVRGTTLHYTLDGSDPDSLSPVVKAPIRVDQTTVIRIKGYKDGWHPSDIADFPLYRNTYKPDSVFLLTRLNRVHLAEGAHTFFDKQLGAIGANNPAWANHFAGVRDNPLELLCWFDAPIDLNSVGIRILVEEETSIYPPGVIEVWGGENENALRLIAKNIVPDLPEPREKPTLRRLELPVKKSGPLKCLKIVAKPYQKGTDRPKLILIDEMFLN